MLILSQGGKTTKLEPQSFPDEAALQAYLAANPQAIPVSNADDPPQLHVLGREFPTLSGPIDILATDENGAAYIVETKLYKNPDKRRVLAQVLDYGAALWADELPTDRLLMTLRERTTRFDLPDPVDALATFLASDADTAERHLGKVRDALIQGRFTAVILMDELGDRLQDLVLFINENSRFRVLAVELDYYRHGDIELVTPRLFGAEVRRPVSGAPRSRGETTDPSTFLAEYAEQFGEAARDAWTEIERGLLSADIQGIRVNHRPGGAPMIVATTGTRGDIQLFILGSGGTVRDLLHRPNFFDTDSTAAKGRADFRATLVSLVPEASVRGKAGRIYLPIEAFRQALSQIIPAVQAFLRNL